MSEFRMPLTWSLVIATYQRENILPLCLNFAAAQTRPPIEVIVVDASQNWETTRNHVIAEIAPRFNGIRWTYEAAEHRSSALQRNEGIRLATADIVFLIDDDTFMHPTCAEEIMKVYESDIDCSISGVEADAVETLPWGTALEEERKRIGYSATLLANWMHSPAAKPANTVMKWIWRNVLLMDAEKRFIPYDGRFYLREIPTDSAKLNVVRVPLLQGYRMTYRRLAILQAQFEPGFQYYAVGEDLDASYRVSRNGSLVLATDAKLHHYNSANGRLSRFEVTALSVVNQAFLIRKNSADVERNKRKYYFLMFRWFIAEFLKDLLSRRWSFPQLRGLLIGIKLSVKLFTVGENDLAAWYLRVQRELLR